MDYMVLSEEQREELVQYYKETGLLVVGLNDSQGVNANFTFFRKGLLSQLVDTLTEGEFIPTMIDAFSLTMNKTEHVDYFLKHNLSLQEIKLSQIYSAVSALKKTMQDMKLPTFIGEVGNVWRFMYPIKQGDDNIHISSSLQQASEPLMIYSSGVNNLMREVGNNPFAIRGDYKNRNKRPNYDYTLKKANDSNTLKKVIDSMRKNYEIILGINPDTDIYTLGAYVPKALSTPEMNLFRDLILAYNEKLDSLCHEYGTHFVDTEEVGRTYNYSKINFHISSGGYRVLANYILCDLYQNKIAHRISKTPSSVCSYSFTDMGARGVVEESLRDWNLEYALASCLSDYEYKRAQEVIEERRRETMIFQKVVEKTKIKK